MPYMEQSEYYEAKKIIFYKFKEGENTKNVHFIEHKNVDVSFEGGIIAVRENGNDIIYPVARLYEAVMMIEDDDKKKDNGPEYVA